MSNPKQILKGLVEELDKNSSVIAFTLVGSQAREDIYKATQYSDMEAYIIVKDDAVEKVEQELPDIIAKFGKILFSFKHQIGFVAVYDDLFRLELPVIKQSDLKSLFSRPKAQIVKVLIDKTNGELGKILEARPETIDFASEFTEKVTNFWYWQIIATQYFKKGEIYNTRAVLNIHASALIKLFELYNDPNILLLETNKRVEQFLSTDQIEILKVVTVSCNMDDIKLALIKVMEIFPEIFKQIKQKYNYVYDESLEKKVKSKLINLID